MAIQSPAMFDYLFGTEMVGVVDPVDRLGNFNLIILFLDQKVALVTPRTLSFSVVIATGEKEQHCLHYQNK
jgi:hypothetical protein